MKSVHDINRPRYFSRNGSYGGHLSKVGNKKNNL